MPQITQPNVIQDGLILSSELQEAINQLYTTINQLDKDNLDRSSNKFLWGNVKLDELLDPDGALASGDSTDLQVAVTKNYLIEKLFDAGGTFDPATGNWHKHSNKAILDGITDKGSGSIITADERSRLPSQDQKEALDNANSPNSSNPVATIGDIPSLAGSQYLNAWQYSTGVSPVTTIDLGTIDVTDGGFIELTVECRVSYSGGLGDNYGFVKFRVIYNGTDFVVFPLQHYRRDSVSPWPLVSMYGYSTDVINKALGAGSSTGASFDNANPNILQMSALDDGTSASIPYTNSSGTNDPKPRVWAFSVGGIGEIGNVSQTSYPLYVPIYINRVTDTTFKIQVALNAIATGTADIKAGYYGIQV